MDFNDLNSAGADDILIGEQEKDQASRSSDSSAENSQETEAKAEGNAEATDQQAKDEQKGESTESEANAGEAKEAGEGESESSEESKAEGETETKDTSETLASEEDKPDPDAILKELSNGQIESATGLTDLLDENQRLKADLEKPREPEFANDRAKQAYDYLQKHSGEFEELTREAHRVLSIDPEGMGDKELQFEAFAMQRKDLSRADAQRVFNLKFEKLFGELEDDPDNEILKDELKVNSIEARANILTAQETLKSELTPKEAGETTTGESQAEADQLTPEQIEEVQQAVKGTLNGYEGLQVKLGKEGKEVVKVALNTGQIESLNDAMRNPAELVDAAIAQFGSTDGAFNYDGYRDFMTSFIHHDRIVQESYNQGINVGKRLALDGAKNLETKEPPAQQQKKEEPSFFDAFETAVKGKT